MNRVKSDAKSKFFVIPYLKSIFRRPKVALTKKQFISTIWGKFIEIPMIGVVWILSKIHSRFEQILAKILSKWWTFKPLPILNSLSTDAIQYKKKKKIEIDKKIDIETKILDFSTVNDIIRAFPFSEIAECGCRSIIMHCDAPKHTCLSLGWSQDASENLQDHSNHSLTNPEDIEKVIDLTDRYALVHMALTFPDPDYPTVICNCCDCCCISFREFLANAVPMISASKYVAKIDSTKCNGCFQCINYRCRFRAILKVNEDGTTIDPRKEDRERYKYKWPNWSERRNGWGTRIRKDPPSWKKIKNQHSGKWFSKVDPNRCFGCGNCASQKYGCPEHAIKLYPRE